MKRSVLIPILASLVIGAPAAWAQTDKIKLGFMTTLSGPIAALGKER